MEKRKSLLDVVDDIEKLLAKQQKPEKEEKPKEG